MTKTSVCEVISSNTPAYVTFGCVNIVKNIFAPCVTVDKHIFILCFLHFCNDKFCHYLNALHF